MASGFKQMLLLKIPAKQGIPTECETQLSGILVTQYLICSRLDWYGVSRILAEGCVDSLRSPRHAMESKIHKKRYIVE
jgi:hypothetical protein